MSSDKKMRFKPTEKGYKAVKFQIRLSEENFNKLEEIAKKKGITKSQVIREWIEKH